MGLKLKSESVHHAVANQCEQQKISLDALKKVSTKEKTFSSISACPKIGKVFVL